MQLWHWQAPVVVDNTRMNSEGGINKVMVILAAAGCFAFAIAWPGFEVREPFKLAVGTRPGSEAMVFALTENRPFTANELRLIEMTGATAISRAVENGVVDAAVISLDEALQMNDSGHPVRIVLVLEESVGADAVLAPPHVTGLEMLKGLRVGVEIRSSSHYLLLQALRRAGLSLADVELLPFTGREVSAAFAANMVDALVLTEPDIQRISHDEMRRIFDSSELEQPILRVLAVREEAWTEKKHMLQKIAGRFLSMQKRMHAGDEGFVSFFARRTRISHEAVRRCLEHVRFPDHARMLEWLGQGKIEDVLRGKYDVMAKAELLSGDQIPLPAWDASLFLDKQP